MQLKQKKNSASTTLFIAVIITGIFIVATAWNASYDELIADFQESVMARDPLFSNYPGIKTLVANLPSIVDGKINGLETRPLMDTVFIDVNPQEYRVLLAERGNAVASNVLVEPSEVNAKVRFNGSQIKADIRLKGDMSDHWLSKVRMSLRIKLKNDASVLGFNEFSLQKPGSRQHPFDSVFQTVVRETGNMASVHQYVEVVFNGQPWGVMIMEEAMTSEFLEKQGRKESLIIRFSNEDKGIVEEESLRTGIEPYNDYRLSDDRLYIKMYGEGKYSVDPVFRKWFTYISEQRVKRDEGELYDVGAYSKALFVASLWNDGHPLWHANSRHYFNPYTLQLQPITTDAFIPFSLKVYNAFFPRSVFNPLTNNSVYNHLINTEQFQQGADQQYDQAVKAMLNAKREYLYFHSFFPLDDFDENFITILEDNISILNHKPNRDVLFTSGEFNVNSDPQLPDRNQIALISDHVHIRHYDDGRVDIYNLLPDSVHLDKLIIDDVIELVVNRDLPAFSPGSYSPLSLNTNLTGLLDKRVVVQTSYADEIRQTHNNLTLMTAGLHNPLLLDTPIDALPFLTYQEEQWTFQPGNWEILNPLVLDGNLDIPPGTNLSFAEGAYLIVKGTMHAVGKVNAPIVFEALNGSWKGVYVLNATEKSRWEHVSLSDFGATEDGLLNLTGGVTFYQSDIVMNEVTLLGARGEDAINLVRSDFTIHKLTIRDSVSDGLDSDFSTGLIADSSFSNINGDAVDFSGSTVEIRNITAEQIFDKAISVGEASNVTVDGGVFSNVGVAIASKDGSSANARNIEISDYILAAAMSYQKKSFYNTASLDLQNISVSGENPFIRQTDSKLTVNGQLLREQDVDVDYLYENTVMQK